MTTLGKYTNVPVIKCDLRGNHLKTYKSAARAAEILGKSPSAIYECLNGNRKSAYGFTWKYAYNPFIDEKQPFVTTCNKGVTTKLVTGSSLDFKGFDTPICNM